MDFTEDVHDEVKVKCNAVRLTCKLPITVKNSLVKSETREFFTLSQMVEAPLQCKEPLCTISFRL